MKGTRASHRYAKAILDLAKENGQEVEVNNNMKLIAKTIAESKDLDVVLKSPVIKAADKKSVLEKIFAGNLDSITLGLINILVENKRLPILEMIAKQYSILFDHLKAIDMAKVTTAVPLNGALKDKVLVKIKELTGKEASIENEVNPDIIGGFVLRVGDIQYDASISNNLNKLRQSFDHSHYVAKI